MNIKTVLFNFVFIFVEWVFFLNFYSTQSVEYDTKYTGTVIKNISIFGFRMCAEACHLSASCKVFNWGKKDLLCQLLEETDNAKFIPEVGTRASNISSWPKKPGRICNDNCTGDSTCVPLKSGKPYCLKPYTRKSTGCSSIGYQLDDYKVICFKVYKTITKTWHLAKAHCESEGGNLVKLDTAHKALHVARAVYKNAKDRIYIGLNDDAVEGKWMWSDGSAMSYNNWRTKGGQPNNKDGSYQNVPANCVAIRTDDGQWTDEYCNKPLGFICERNDIAMN